MIMFYWSWVDIKKSNVIKILIEKKNHNKIIYCGSGFHTLTSNIGVWINLLLLGNSIESSIKNCKSIKKKKSHNDILTYL